MRRYFAHDWDQTLALAVAGIDASHDGNRPGALLCRCMAIPALRSSGDVEGARAMAAALRPAAVLCSDVFLRSSIYLALIEQAFWTDLDDAPALVSEYSNWAHSLGTPSICSMAEFSTGRVKAWVRQPRDFDGAIRCYHEGLRLAQSVRDLRAETANLLGLAFVHSALDSDDASSTCQAALVRLRDMRSVHGLLLLLDAVVGWFLRTGVTEPAGVLCGFLDARPAANRDRDRRSAELRTRTVLERPDGHALMAAGARMSQDEAVAFTLSHMGGG